MRLYVFTLLCDSDYIASRDPGYGKTRSNIMVYFLSWETMCSCIHKVWFEAFSDFSKFYTRGGELFKRLFSLTFI